MNDKHYILKDKTPVAVDLTTWAEWFESHNRSVIKTSKDDYIVSTVFLGLDHNFKDTGDPILFETMVFKNNSLAELYCDRYSTWKEAEAGHIKACKKYFKYTEKDLFLDML